MREGKEEKKRKAYEGNRLDNHNLRTNTSIIQAKHGIEDIISQIYKEMNQIYKDRSHFQTDKYSMVINQQCSDEFKSSIVMWKHAIEHTKKIRKKES